MTVPVQISAALILSCVPIVTCGESPDAIRQAETVCAASDAAARELIKLIPDSDPYQREQALLLLGKLRNQLAIRPLLDNLLTRGESAGEPNPLESFPAAISLRSMGSPVYPQVWGALSERRSSTYIRVLAYTLIGIDGQQIAVMRVRQRGNEERVTDEQRNNLRQLLEVLESIDASNVREWPAFSIRR